MKYVDRARADRPVFLHSEEFSRVQYAIMEYMREGSRQTRAPFDPVELRDTDAYPILSDLFDRACAYCERPLDEEAYAEVHLHRPAGFAADPDGQSHRLHYVWLALEWDNMLPVCSMCYRAKSNFFPIERKRGELGAGIDELNETEGPLLLDPCRDVPFDHFRFLPNGWVEAKSRRGDAAIRLFDLNREDLLASRKDVYGSLPLYLDENWHSLGPEGPDENTRLLFFGPHAGATTLAFFEWLRTSLPQAGELPGPGAMLRLLEGLTVDERNNLAQGFVDAAMGGDSPIAFKQTTSFVTKASTADDGAPRKADRTLKLSNLPLATNPIQKVRIRNFKALKDIEFSLPLKVDNPDLVPSMLILGENATGKSSVLEAVTLALLGQRETAELDTLLDDEDIKPADYVHREDFDDWTSVSDEPLSVEIAYTTGSAVSRLTGTAGRDTFDGDEGTAKIMLAYGPRRFFTKKPRRRFRAPAYRVRSLFDPMDVIPNPVEWLNSLDDEKFDAAARALREILMLDRSAMFARMDGRIIIETESGRTPLSDMSVGYKSVIAMCTDIIREMFYHYDNLEFASAVVLIDEIETHLHPRWKMRIMSLLRRAFPRIQFIVTTHDPLCLKGMYDGEVFVLERSATDQMVETLKDLPNPQGMRAEQILTSEFFGLGSTDPETDAKLIRYHNLTRKADTRTETENTELERLRHELSDRMAIGDTVQDQVMAEALKKAAIDPVAPLSKIEGTSRKKMVSDLLGALKARG